VGQQAMADRFSYFPTIGIAVMLCWSLPRGLAATHPRRTAAWCAVATVLLALGASTWKQTTYWKDSQSLFQHAVEATDRNYLAHTYLGAALAMREDFDGAERHLQAALMIAPGYNFAHDNLGSVLARQGRLEEAAAQFEEALRIDPRSPNAHYNLGSLLARQGRSEEAIAHFEEALAIDPEH